MRTPALSGERDSPGAPSRHGWTVLGGYAGVNSPLSPSDCWDKQGPLRPSAAFQAALAICRPSDSSFTFSVVKELPAIPQSPLLTSSTITEVTERKFSPSMETIVSVSLRIISCFCAGEKTPSITFIFTNGRARISHRPRRMNSGDFSYPPPSRLAPEEERRTERPG